MPPAVRSSLWFSICNFMQRGIALITVPVFTRLLTTEEYGVCNVYFAWAEMILVFTSLQIPYEGLNNGLIRYEKDKDGYTSAMAGLILVMTVQPGFGGQKFKEDMMPKLRSLRSRLDEVNPGCILSVDGGVDRNTAPICKANGAGVLVTGSSYFHAVDRIEYVRNLQV